MERKTSRKQLTGVVVSNKNDKTIVVAVDTYKTHKLYNKRFKSTKKYSAHDEKNMASLGDIVLLSETRPYSKTKNFRLVKIKSKKVGA